MPLTLNELSNRYVTGRSFSGEKLDLSGFALVDCVLEDCDITLDQQVTRFEKTPCIDCRINGVTDLLEAGAINLEMVDCQWMQPDHLYRS